MLLYRPRAASYHEAMRHVRLFSTPLEMNNYIIGYHNLYNLLRSPSDMFLLKTGNELIPDNRNGWMHSRYICLGNTPLGIYDGETLEDIKRPLLKIDVYNQNGLKCQFDLMGETYLFFVGIDQWTTQSKCIGYKNDQMELPFFRLDNVPITRDDFTQTLYCFIAQRAIKKVQAQQKRQQDIEAMKLDRKISAH